MGRYSRNDLKRHDKVLTGSSDMVYGQIVFLLTDRTNPCTSIIGNVSYKTPTLHTMFAIPASTTRFHITRRLQLQLEQMKLMPRH